MKEKDLNRIAKSIVNSLSFNYDSFENAKITINIENYHYTYDATTLCIYEHNLPKEYYYKLNKAINNEYKLLSLTNEEIKERNERIILHSFIKLHPEYMDWDIKKCLHPDFVISKNLYSFGIEITEMVDGLDKVINKAASDNFGKGLTSKELEANVRKKYGEKNADQMLFYNHGIGVNMFNVDDRKKNFINLVERKFIKYENIANDFNRFLVLCSASGMEITSQYDVDDIFDQIKYFPLNEIEVGIIYSDGYNKAYFSSKKFKK